MPQQEQHRLLIKNLLETDADVNAHCIELDNVPVTPLMLCTAVNLHEFIDPLISRGALVNGTPGLHPLIVAASNGLNAVVTKLIHHKANIEIREDDKTPLHLATYCGHLETVRLLLDKGANFNAEGHCSYLRLPASLESVDTPLLIAIRRNYFAIASLLLERGAQKQLLALHTAIRESNIRLVELLIQHGADVNGYCDEMNALDVAHQTRTEVPGARPRSHARRLISILDNSPLIRLLLKSGANPLKKNDSGENIIPPQYYIFPNHRKASCANYFENRQAYLASSSLTIEQCNQIFLIAFFLRDTSIIAKIIESLKDTNREELQSMLNNHSINWDSNTVLMEAVQEKDTELIELLLKTGLMNCNKKNKKGFTALHYALLCNSEDVMFCLEDDVHEIMNIINRYVPLLNERLETIQRILPIMNSNAPLTSKQSTDLQSIIDEIKFILHHIRIFTLAASKIQLKSITALVSFITLAKFIPELKSNEALAPLINKIHCNEKIVSLLIQSGANPSAEILALAAAINYNIATALLLLKCDKANILA